MSLSDEDFKNLKALGSGATSYSFSNPTFEVLERFPSPFIGDVVGGVYRGKVNIVCPEFTSLCPKTGQPDFATIVIDYTPYKWCVESKSLKLYLMGYRNHGAFHESCVQNIARHLVYLLEPEDLKIVGQFTPRGGIPFWPTVEYFSDRSHGAC